MHSLQLTELTHSSIPLSSLLAFFCPLGSRERETLSGTDGERKREGKKLALSIKGCNDNICQGIIFFPIVSFILNNSSDGNFETGGMLLGTGEE